MSAEPTRGPMGWSTRAPCASCPYRKDTPIGLWSPEEFRDLLVNDADDGYTSPIYECHATKKNPQVCGGWLLDQKRGGPRATQLRIALIFNEEAQKAWLEVTDGGHPRYGSIVEMVRAQGFGRGVKLTRSRRSRR